MRIFFNHYIRCNVNVWSIQMMLLLKMFCDDLRQSVNLSSLDYKVNFYKGDYKSRKL